VRRTPSGYPPVVIVIEVVFLLVFWAWVFAATLFLRQTVLPRLPIIMSPPPPAETVRFPATDGVSLEGWLLPGEAGRPWILICHGVGANRADLLDIASTLRSAGFNLFLFDFRGHGASGGLATSFGWREQRDLEGALAYLGQQDIPPKPYGIYGISMGAAVALLVAARDERLGAVAVDSPYTDLEDSLGRHLALMYPALPRQPFLWFILATYRLRFGVWPRQVSPTASAARLSPRPLLLIQGAEDPRMPVAGAQAIAAAAGPPKDLWIVPGAGHLEGYAFDPQGYQSRLISFFESSLK